MNLHVRDELITTRGRGKKEEGRKERRMEKRFIVKEKSQGGYRPVRGRQSIYVNGVPNLQLM